MWARAIWLLYVLLLMTNAGWAFAYFLDRKWKARALRAWEQLSQIRETHSVMLRQLDEILRWLRPGMRIQIPLSRRGRLSQ